LHATEQYSARGRRSGGIGAPQYVFWQGQPGVGEFVVMSRPSPWRDQLWPRYRVRGEVVEPPAIDTGARRASLVSATTVVDSSNLA
jgi:hypothetical protein